MWRREKFNEGTNENTRSEDEAINRMAKKF